MKTTTVYLLHFERKHYHAQHYLGSTSDLPKRIDAHAKGKTNALVKAFKKHHIPFVLATTWEGDRITERKLKNRKNGRKLCPICMRKM